MNHMIRFTILWSLSASTVWAQESPVLDEVKAATASEATPPNANTSPFSRDPVESASIEAVQSVEPTQIKVFVLQYCQAADTARLLQELISSTTFRAVADERTNSVIVTGTTEQLETIEALLRRLDEPRKTPEAKLAPIENETAKLVVQLQDELTQLRLSSGDMHPKVRQLQSRIDAARQTVATPSQSWPQIRGRLYELQSLRGQLDDINEEIQLANTNLERAQRSAEAGFATPSEMDEARLQVVRVRARLRIVEDQYAAAREQMKAELLQMIEESLKNWVRSGVDERSKIAETEAQVPRIIDLVGQSPEEARKAAVEFANRLDRESIDRLEVELAGVEKRMENGEGHPFSAAFANQLKQRLADLRRGLRARTMLSGMNVPDTRLTEPSPQASEVEKEMISFTGDSVAELRRQFEQADKLTRTLANQLDQQPDQAKKDELRKYVQQTFTARQNLLRAELMEMQARLLQTQNSIDSRERIADQIIDRRVEDLLTPQRP
jgi:uncharacterized phage infection (PIP) family protein YhgE